MNLSLQDCYRIGLKSCQNPKKVIIIASTPAWRKICAQAGQKTVALIGEKLGEMDVQMGGYDHFETDESKVCRIKVVPSDREWVRVVGLE